MGRNSNYGGNVFWPHRVGCVCNEERQKNQRINRDMGYSRKLQKPSCETYFCYIGLALRGVLIILSIKDSPLS